MVVFTGEASGPYGRVEASAMPQETPTVFVVDDDISVRESLEALIQSVGWQPEVYASAQEFLSRPPALGPSCLILDVNLPDLNGLDLQTCVVADRTDMPIIFITGYYDGQSHEGRCGRVLDQSSKKERYWQPSSKRSSAAVPRLTSRKSCG